MAPKLIGACRRHHVERHVWAHSVGGWISNHHLKIPNYCPFVLFPSCHYLCFDPLKLFNRQLHKIFVQEDFGQEGEKLALDHKGLIESPIYHMLQHISTANELSRKPLSKSSLAPTPRALRSFSSFSFVFTRYAPWVIQLQNRKYTSFCPFVLQRRLLLEIS